MYFSSSTFARTYKTHIDTETLTRERESSNNDPGENLVSRFVFVSMFISSSTSVRLSKILARLNCPIVRDIRCPRCPFRDVRENRKRGGGGRRKRSRGEESSKKNLFAVHPRHFTREHFAAVSLTRCTFLLARVLVYFFSFFLSSFFYFFFEFPGLPPLFTPLIVLRVWLQTRRALSHRECNFCNDFPSPKLIPTAANFLSPSSPFPFLL